MSHSTGLQEVPEPATFTLLVVSLIVYAVSTRRRRMPTHSMNAPLKGD